jgi:catalase
MFYRSVSDVEQGHLVEALTFEPGKCDEQAIKERELAVLANVDADLCQKVSDQAPTGQGRHTRTRASAE